MITILPELLDAMMKGGGFPRMMAKIYTFHTGVWHLLGGFEIHHAILSRLIYDIDIQFNLLQSGYIEVPSLQPYAVMVERGANIGTNYRHVDSLKYHIAQATYNPYTGRTRIIANLLPIAAAAGVTGGATVADVVSDIFLLTHAGTFTYNVAEDIFYEWQFQPTGTILNLSDTRTLHTIMANKYLAYFYPRSDGIKLFNVTDMIASLSPTAPSYTPYDTAIIKQIFTSVQGINTSWVDTNGVTNFNIIDASYPIQSLGYISTLAPGSPRDPPPTDEPNFNDWGQFTNAVYYEIETRPDLRIEQGDVVFYSMDGFTVPRAIEYIEEFHASRVPRWRQIIYEIPLMPWMYEEWFRQFEPINRGPMGGNNSEMVTNDQAFNSKLNTDQFGNILTTGEMNVQVAVDILEKTVQVGTELPDEGRGNQIYLDTVTGLLSISDGLNWHQVAVIILEHLLTELGEYTLTEDLDHIMLESRATAEHIITE